MSAGGPACAGWDTHVHVFDAAAPVLAGHYRPADRPLAAIEAQAAALGVHHLVLVQPSVYGADPQVLLRALGTTPGRHRGVIVPPAAADRPADGLLDAMHVAGVRGLRFNRVSPVGHRGDAARDHAWWAPRLAARGWHLQWYVAPRELPEVARLHAPGGAPAVLDHLGGLTAAHGEDAATWEALMRLADAGAWVKLSGWYRLGETAPYDRLAGIVRRLDTCFAGRLVWGSDWPHTGFAPRDVPPYPSTWTPVVDALGAERAAAILVGAARLYG